MMGRILCFGELLLRFSPAPRGGWLKSNTLPVYLGGAELNVATALGKWNAPASYCSANLCCLLGIRQVGLLLVSPLLPRIQSLIGLLHDAEAGLELDQRYRCHSKVLLARSLLSRIQRS